MKTTTQENRQWAASLYRKCGNVSDVAEAMKVSEETIRRWLRGTGLMKTTEQQYMEKAEKIAEMWDGKESVYSLGQRTGISTAVIRRALIATGNLDKPPRPSEIKRRKSVGNSEALELKESRYGAMVVQAWHGMVAA